MRRSNTSKLVRAARRSLAEMVQSLESRRLFSAVVNADSTVLNADGTIKGYTVPYDVPGGIVITAPNKKGSASSDGAPGYQITLNFTGGLTASQQAVFTAAAARWQAILTTDLPDVGAIDDMKIDASGAAIDGVGNVLGQSSPSGQRSGTLLPYSGFMQFDTADLASMEADGSLNNVITHEMGHVLGIGTIWAQRGLTINANTSSWAFTGAAALTQWKAISASTTATNTPVENTGGAGTAGGHWRETSLANELMTGYINNGSNPLSRLSAASLQDLGYPGVNIDAADAFSLATNALPSIGSFGATPNSVTGGANVTLSLTAAGDTGSNGGLGSILFYRESNGIAGLQGQGNVQLDTLVATITPAGNPTSVTNQSAVISTNGLPNGTYTYYARVVDKYGLVSTTTRSLTVTISNVVAPPTPSVPVLDVASDTGTSSTDGITKDNTPTFTGTAQAGITVTLTASGQPIGSTIAAGDGTWSITTSVLPDGVYPVVATASNVDVSGVPSDAVNVTIDTTAPALSSVTYDGEITQDITMNVGGSVVALTPADVKMHNNTTGLDVTVDQLVVGADPAIVKAKFNSVLPNGNYVFSINPGALRDDAGNVAASTSTLSVHRLNGDITHNDTVDFFDLVTFAQQYNKTGQTFSTGNLDFSPDGLVGFTDLVILAQNYNLSLPSLVSAVSAGNTATATSFGDTQIAATAVTSTKTKRVAAGVLS